MVGWPGNFSTCTLEQFVVYIANNFFLASLTILYIPPNCEYYGLISATDPFCKNC